MSKAIKFIIGFVILALIVVVVIAEMAFRKKQDAVNESTEKARKGKEEKAKEEKTKENLIGNEKPIDDKTPPA